MKRIFKYELPTHLEPFSLPMPDTATFLCIKIQNGKPMLWAEVDDSHVIVTGVFCQNFFTGNSEIPDGVKYLSTWLFDDLVYHTYALSQQSRVKVKQ